MNNAHLNYEKAETCGLARVKLRKERKARFLNGKKPRTEAEWVKVADDLYLWADTTEAIDINAYALERNFPPYSFYLWKKENEFFRETLEWAIYKINQRRLKAQTNRDKEIYRTMPLYDFALAEYEASLKKCNHPDNHGKEFKVCDCQAWPSDDRVKPPITNTKEE